MNQTNAVNGQAPNYVSLVRMTLSESTDYDYDLNLSGYQAKLMMWSLMYLEHNETDIPQLDLPKSMWANLRGEIMGQIDQVGGPVDPRVESQNHIDVMNQIHETS